MKCRRRGTCLMIQQSYMTHAFGDCIQRTSKFEGNDVLDFLGMPGQCLEDRSCFLEKDPEFRSVALVQGLQQIVSSWLFMME